MTSPESRVTIHMAASLDGFIARRDGRVDWLETADHYADGENPDKETMAAFLATIDAYLMGAKTYETALGFEAKGFGWAYGDTPVFVLTHRELPRIRESVELRSGDLDEIVESLRARFRNLWIVGGGAVAGECLRRGLADELRYAILPVLVGDGIPFFDRLDRDVALHLSGVKAYGNGIVELSYAVRGGESKGGIPEGAP
jgi:dihydrofolate reductase